MVSGFPRQTLAKPVVRSEVIIQKQAYKVSGRGSLFPSFCSISHSLTRKLLSLIRTATDICLLLRNLSLLPSDFRFGQYIFLLKKNVTFTRNVSIQILQSDKHAKFPTEIKEVPEGKTWPQIRILIIVILCNPFPAKKQKWPILHNKFTDLPLTQYQGFSYN